MALHSTTSQTVAADQSCRSAPTLTSQRAQACGCQLLRLPLSLYPSPSPTTGRVPCFDVVAHSSKDRRSGWLEDSLCGHEGGTARFLWHTFFSPFVLPTTGKLVSQTTEGELSLGTAGAAMGGNHGPDSQGIPSWAQRPRAVSRDRGRVCSEAWTSASEDPLTSCPDRGT